MAARIITVFSGKGGVAKTTTVLSLATLLAAARNRVMVLDTDVQKSATLYHDRLTQLGVEVPFEVVDDTDPQVLGRLREVEGFDYILVDTPPNLREADVVEAVVGASDFVVVPTPVALFDAVACVDSINTFIRPAGKPYKVLFTRVESRGAVNEAGELIEVAIARETFAEQKIPVFDGIVRSLKAFPEGQTEGRLITELRTRGQRSAKDDYDRVTAELLSDLVRTTAAR